MVKNSKDKFFTYCNNKHRCNFESQLTGKKLQNRTNNKVIAACNNINPQDYTNVKIQDRATIPNNLDKAFFLMFTVHR